MKTLLTSILILAFTSSSVAVVITARTNNGRWSAAGTWNPNRAPADGDTVRIPLGFTVRVDGNEELDGVVIEIAGTMHFTNGRLRLDRYSKVIVQYGGVITGGGNNDQLRINNTLKYRGSDPDVHGYAVADINSGGGFVYIPTILPVQFLSFYATKKSGGVELKWSATNEANNKHFEIQRSEDGRNWKAIAHVFPSNSSDNVHTYTFQDKLQPSRPLYYRIRQVDEDGAETFSVVRSVNAAESNAVKAYKSGSNIVVEFDKAPAADFSIRIVTMNGQILSENLFRAAPGRVTIPLTSARGAHVIQVIDGANSQACKLFL